MEQPKETIYRFNGSDWLKANEPDYEFIEKIEVPSDSGGTEFSWEPVTVNEIWISDGPRNCQIHANLEGGWGTDKKSYIITPEEYRKFKSYKGDKRRINLLLSKSREDLRKRKINADCRIDFRVPRQVAEEIKANAKMANKTVSRYCRELIEGKKPRAALTPEEQSMIMEVVRLRADMARFRGAVIGGMKKVSEEERPYFLINGQHSKWWREKLQKALIFLDEFINKYS